MGGDAAARKQKSSHSPPHFPPQVLLTEQFRSCKAPSEPPGVLSPRPPSRQPVDLLAGSTPLPPSSAATAAAAAGAFGPPGGATYAVLSRQASGALPPELAGSPVSGRLLEAVRQRARGLEQQLLVQRAFLMPCADRPAVLRQLQLRALREFDLPEVAIGAAFSPAERHHGLVAAAAAASAEEAVTGSSEQPLAAPTGPQYSSHLHGAATGHGGMHANVRCYERYHGASAMTASWSGGGSGGNFPPDVTLAHARATAVATAPPPPPPLQPTSGQRVRREQGASSDEYEDTACIL